MCFYRYELETDENRIDLSLKIGNSYLGYELSKQQYNQIDTDESKHDFKTSSVERKQKDLILDVLNDEVVKKCLDAIECKSLLIEVLGPSET